MRKHTQTGFSYLTGLTHRVARRSRRDMRNNDTKSAKVAQHSSYITGSLTPGLPVSCAQGSLRLRYQHSHSRSRSHSDVALPAYRARSRIAGRVSWRQHVRRSRTRDQFFSAVGRGCFQICCQLSKEALAVKKETRRGRCGSRSVAHRSHTTTARRSLHACSGGHRVSANSTFGSTQQAAKRPVNHAVTNANTRTGH